MKEAETNSSCKHERKVLLKKKSSLKCLKMGLNWLNQSTNER